MDIPFCLVCRDCDLGAGLNSLEEAYWAGWVHIDEIEDPDAPWTHVGLCPDCKVCEDYK